MWLRRWRTRSNGSCHRRRRGDTAWPVRTPPSRCCAGTRRRDHRGPHPRRRDPARRIRSTEAARRRCGRDDRRGAGAAMDLVAQFDLHSAMLAHQCGNVTSAIMAQFADPPRSMDRFGAPSTGDPTRKHWPTRRIGPRSMAACPSGSHGPRSMLVSTVLSLNCGQRASGSVTRSGSTRQRGRVADHPACVFPDGGRGRCRSRPAPSPRVASRVRVGRVQGFRHHRPGPTDPIGSPLRPKRWGRRWQSLRPRPGSGPPLKPLAIAPDTAATACWTSGTTSTPNTVATRTYSHSPTS